MTSPAFSGKFTGMLLGSGRGGSGSSPRTLSSSLHAAAAGHSPNGTPSHSRSASMVQGVSPLSSGLLAAAVGRRSSTGTAGLQEPPAAAAAATPEAAAGASFMPVEPSAAAAEPLPLSTLRLSIDGTGTPGGTSGGGAAPGDSSSSSAAAAAGGGSPGRDISLSLKGLAPEAARHRLQELDGQVKEWKAAWEEAERQERILREEVARLESMSQITDRDALYLRSVIVSGFESGELPTNGAMFGVLGRLLHFSPQEMRRIKQHATSKSSGSISSLVLGAVGGGPAVGGGGVRR